MGEGVAGIKWNKMPSNSLIKPIIAPCILFRLQSGSWSGEGLMDVFPQLRRGGTEETVLGIFDPIVEQKVALPPVSLFSLVILPLQRNSVSHRTHFLQSWHQIYAAESSSTQLSFLPTACTLSTVWFQWEVPLYHIHFMDEKTEA